MAHDKHRGFPVVKVPGHCVNHMEWKDGALIVTVGPPHKTELWNFTTTTSNYFQELQSGIQSLMRSSVAELPGNIQALAVTANARFEFIEKWRKQMLPEHYPKQSI